MKSNNIIFLKPYLSEKIWGGKRLQDFGYQLPSDHVGEALIISALPQMSSVILNDEYKGMSYLEFFQTHKAFFNNYNKPYPLLTKLIDANDKLSVQVHPDDSYAQMKHHSLGKTECWYIVDAEPGAELVYGVKTHSKQESQTLVENKQWDKFLNRISVKKGDFVFVPAGMVHAIGKGILIYELQQSCDITYRLYDYDRLDHGKPRDLHIEDSLNVIKYNITLPSVNDHSKVLVDCDFFYLEHIKVNGSHEIYFKQANWTEVTVLEGKGKVENNDIKKGDAFVIRHDTPITINGDLELLISYSKY